MEIIGLNVTDTGPITMYEVIKTMEYYENEPPYKTSMGTLYDSEEKALNAARKFTHSYSSRSMWIGEGVSKLIYPSFSLKKRTISVTEITNG